MFTLYWLSMTFLVIYGTKRKNLADPKFVKAYLLSAVQHKLIRQLSQARSRQNEITKMESPGVIECREDQMIEDQIQLEQTIL